MVVEFEFALNQTQRGLPTEASPPCEASLHVTDGHLVAKRDAVQALLVCEVPNERLIVGADKEVPGRRLGIGVTLIARKETLADPYFTPKICDVVTRDVVLDPGPRSDLKVDPKTGTAAGGAECNFAGPFIGACRPQGPRRRKIQGLKIGQHFGPCERGGAKGVPDPQWKLEVETGDVRKRPMSGKDRSATLGALD